MENVQNLTTIEERNKFDGSLIYMDDSFEKKSGRDNYLAVRKKDDKNLWFIDSDKNFIKKESGM